MTQPALPRPGLAARAAARRLLCDPLDYRLHFRAGPAMVDLSSFLGYLDSIHARTRRVAVLIPPGDLEWAPAPGRFSFGDLLRHLAGIERHMYGETVHGHPSRYPGHDRSRADGFDAVLAYYDRLHLEARALFVDLSDARLMDKCVTPAGTPSPSGSGFVLIRNTKRIIAASYTSCWACVAFKALSLRAQLRGGASTLRTSRLRGQILQR